MHFSGRRGLIFLVSDFHWPIGRLGAVLDFFAHTYLVPMIVWDPAEIEPPRRNAIAALRDAESGVRRTLWLRAELRVLLGAIGEHLVQSQRVETTQIAPTILKLLGLDPSDLRAVQIEHTRALSLD